MPVAGRAGREPLVVGPVVGRLGDDRRVQRRHLGGEGQRVGLLPPLPVGAEDVVAVPGAHLHAGDEHLPHAGGAQRAHRVRAGLPVVEVAGDLHPAGAGGPHGEGDALDAAPRGLVPADVRAQDLPQPLVPALADEVLVQLADRGQPAVGVVHGVRRGAPGAVAVDDLHPVVAGLRGQQRLVDAAAVQLPRLVAGAVLVQDRDGDRLGPQRADGPAVGGPVGAEHRVRVVRPPLDHGPQVVAGHAPPGVGSGCGAGSVPGRALRRRLRRARLRRVGVRRHGLPGGGPRGRARLGDRRGGDDRRRRAALPATTSACGRWMSAGELAGAFLRGARLAGAFAAGAPSSSPCPPRPPPRRGCASRPLPSSWRGPSWRRGPSWPRGPLGGRALARRSGVDHGLGLGARAVGRRPPAQLLAGGRAVGGLGGAGAVGGGHRVVVLFVSVGSSSCGSRRRRSAGRGEPRQRPAAGSSASAGGSRLVEALVDGLVRLEGTQDGESAQGSSPPAVE